MRGQPHTACPTTMTLKEIQAELKLVAGKRWMQRRRNSLEARLKRVQQTTQPPVGVRNANVSAPDSSQPECKMSCVTKPRCTRSRAKAIEPSPEQEISKKCNPYGTLVEATTRPPPKEASKRKRVVSDDEDESEDDCEPADRAPTMDLDSEDYCSQCNIAMKLVPHRALMVCTQCGCVSSYIDSTTNSMAYGEEIDFSQQYSYRRANHWKLAVAQLQAIENTEVKQDVLDKVLEELYTRGITKPEDVTPKILREVLKKLKLRKCYDHIPQIYSRITGVPPIRFTPEIEEQLRLMFIAIQEPFSKVAPAARKNFLSYKYLLHKVAELCGFDEILPFLSLLKGKDKLMRQDAIYQGICQQLNWQYLPSI